MYRAITWTAIQHGVDISDEDAVSKIAEKTPIDIQPPTKADGRSSDVIVEKEDITWACRKPAVDTNVSTVAAYAGVRAALSQQQRRIGLRGNVVMVGRDIGTVVMPEAKLKIYLDASAEERAQRRYDEVIARGEQANYAEILTKVKERDHVDSTRDLAPLRSAEDAIILNSDNLDIQQVFEKIMALYK